MDWIEFKPGNPLPAERRKVLCSFMGTARFPDAKGVAVGWLRYAAGELDSPHFITPGVGGVVTHWSDCLGDAFAAPAWPDSVEAHGRPARVWAP